jgi:hypothetical protein
MFSEVGPFALSKRFQLVRQQRRKEIGRRMHLQMITPIEKLWWRRLNVSHGLFSMLGKNRAVA